MIVKISFFVLLLCFGVLLFILSILNKNRLKKHKDIIAGIYPKENNEEENKSSKNKQQKDLELLLISNNPLLKFLGEVDKNIKLKLFISFIIFAFYYLFNMNKDKAELMLGFSGVFILVILIPGVITSMILKKKIKSIMNDLPGFIDLVAVCVQTGMIIDMALKQIAKDFKTLNPDLTYVMLRIIRKSELTSLSVALDDLIISLPTREVRMFTTVLQQSLNFGSSIYGQLIQLSADIRELQLLAIEERLGTLAAKMSIPLIAFIMFPIIILILAPGAMRVFPHVF
ncbi:MULTISPECIES: type II secretion system F family protein [Pasteurellaceae]|uniref:Type II secretion system F family protein n=1 Tax=Pasteurella atlantica TaxID=2827233 RepID=A0AAW8CN40_9PAST|nr:type II secretion system F family protein [Pasteurella atlantica]MBR0573540.1 type II secretion system F family protein [Pasteurella atlantica]MDP8039601.1 type II secretion system F family protein [Pasteurella atlantica]MDP8041692.1 type II secretion system F family protein [Pasteurella atlantica]MDP8043827.1 type II secretion system F family protein [Pasteurella atlantica]MDP8045913.1 type II secretion system F family protein [Pasteurella atlantica]